MGFTATAVNSTTWTPELEKVCLFCVTNAYLTILIFQEILECKYQVLLAGLEMLLMHAGFTKLI